MDNSQFGGVSYNQQADHFGDNILGNQINNYIKLEPLPEIDLNEALALLQALPTKVLPQAAPEQLPAWSRFQRLQQAYFVGRDTELLQIARTLKQGSTCLITTGIAGAGKSSLASEFLPIATAAILREVCFGSPLPTHKISQMRSPSVATNSGYSMSKRI